MYSLYGVPNAPRFKVPVSLYHKANIEVKEKLFTSSSNICPEALCIASPPRHHPISQLIPEYII